MAAITDTGGRLEELLRDYFLDAGYFVVRGLKITFGGSEVTDLDLWLYLRPSPFTRERVNVDAKYKQSPKAMERVLWAKGAQEILGLQRCIVATTDNRSVVADFGRQHDVLVLDGDFIKRLQLNSPTAITRLTEEEFLAQLGTKDPESTEWKNRLAAARSRLLSSLDFSGCNYWLDDAQFFFREGLRSTKRSEAAFRIGLACMSYFLIGLDYATKDLAFGDSSSRKTAIDDGLRYGSGGFQSMRERVDLASNLIEKYAPQSQALAGQIRRSVFDDLEKLPLKGVTEFLSKTEVGFDLFALAREFESVAYRSGAITGIALPKLVSAAIGVVLDMAELDRIAFAKHFAAPSEA